MLVSSGTLGGQVRRHRITACSGGVGSGKTLVGAVHFANGLKGQRVYVVPKHSIVIVVSANISDTDADKAYAALVRGVVSAVQSDRPINRSASDANRLAEQLACHSPASPGTLDRNQGKMSRGFQNRTTIALGRSLTNFAVGSKSGVSGARWLRQQHPRKQQFWCAAANGRDGNDP